MNRGWTYVKFCVALALASAIAPASAQATKPGQAKPAVQGARAEAEQAESIIDDVVKRLWVQADRHWHEGEYNHIVNLYRVSAASRPNLVDAYSNAGYLLWSMNRDDEAVAFYEQGLKSNPETYHLFDELGFYYYNRKKDYPRAITYYEKAIMCKDCEPFTLHMLAHAYERTRQPDKALKIWERAAAITDNPALDVAKNNVARLRKQN
jgi:tetratricopeptide (TPR) repeat protein